HCAAACHQPRRACEYAPPATPRQYRLRRNQSRVPRCSATGCGQSGVQRAPHHRSCHHLSCPDSASECSPHCANPRWLSPVASSCVILRSASVLRCIGILARVRPRVGVVLFARRRGERLFALERFHVSSESSARHILVGTGTSALFSRCPVSSGSNTTTR